MYIIQTQQVVSMYLGIRTHILTNTDTHVTTIKEKESMTLK